MPFDLFKFLACCWFLVTIDDLKRRHAEADQRGIEIQQRWAAAGVGLAKQVVDQ